MGALHLALSLLRHAAQGLMRRLMVTLGLWTLGLAFGLIGVAGLLVAGFILVAEALGPLAAALILAAGGFGLALVFLAIASRRRLIPDLPLPEPRAQGTEDPKATLEVWLPLILLALLGYLMGSGRKG